MGRRGRSSLVCLNVGKNEGKSTTFADLPINITITDHLVILVFHRRGVGEEGLGSAERGSATPLLVFLLRD
jgi:hypothetical protein